MIRNRFAEILAQKNIRQVDISKATGISRATLSSIALNSTDMVKFSTIDKICQFLGVTPSDFFDYFPYTVVVACENEKESEQSIRFLVTVSYQKSNETKYRAYYICEYQLNGVASLNPRPGISFDNFRIGSSIGIREEIYSLIEKAVLDHIEHYFKEAQNIDVRNRITYRPNYDILI